jgi:argonaute-like protein implicated in RNA metabolism and viral defense
VMVHNTTDRGHRKEDQLAAMVTRELRQIDIVASVMHTAVSQECYEMARSDQGTPYYRVKDRARGRFSGYLRGVALNCVLLTNHRWPFALATPLHADLIVGIDVKHNTAGFLAVGSNGASFRRKIANSRQKEQLLPDQVYTYFSEVIREEALDRNTPIRNIVVQRDGRLFPGEREGLKRAFEDLKRDGLLPADATLTLIEIPKSSPVPLRLFDVSERDGRTWVDNPQVGAYYLAGENDGYVCTTGRAFRRKGTVRPLHVRRVEGPMSLEHCLEDVYALSVLAWTRPEDCTRDPITTKLNDRFLGEAATEYDRDALAFVRSDDAEIDDEDNADTVPSEDEEEEV